MSGHAERGPLLTLEPLVDAVRDGVEAAGWELSGLQKTTSHQFEGRWEGESTRSAYLFFHHPAGRDDTSVDVYLDETSSGGLRGNLALVVDGPALGALGDLRTAMEVLGRAASERLPEGYRTPVTLRFRLRDAGGAAGEATSEIRFKLQIPRVAIEAGGSAVSALASATVGAFEALVRHPGVRRYAPDAREGGPAP